MSYSSQALLSADGDFWNRVAACAAIEVPMSHSPTQWASDHIWRVAAAPGFDDAYAYALANNNPRPGNDPSVITDAQILGAVQQLLGQESPPTTEQLPS